MDAIGPDSSMKISKSGFQRIDLLLPIMQELMQIKKPTQGQGGMMITLSMMKVIIRSNGDLHWNQCRMAASAALEAEVAEEVERAVMPITNSRARCD